MNYLWVLYDPNKETQSEKLTTEEAQFVILRLKTKLINEYLIWREDWPKWKKLNIFLDSPESPFMNIIPIKSDDSSDNKKIKSNSKTEDPTKMSPADGDTVKRVRASFEASEVKTAEVDIKDVFGKTKQQFDGDQFSNEHNLEGMDALEGLVGPGQNKAGFDFKKLNKKNAFSKRNSEDNYKIELLLNHNKGHMFRTTAKDISLTGTFCEKIIPPEFHNTTFDVIIINNLINDDDFKRLTLKGSIVVTDSRTYIQFVQMSDEQKSLLRACLDYYLRALKRLTEK